MSLPLPDLDGRAWADLVQEAMARLPRHAPEWTDYNAHDPGITIAELLAYTAEQALYRTNRVTDGLLRAFLKLSGPGALPAGSQPARLPLAFRVPASSAPLHLPAGLILVPEPAEPVPSEGGEPARLEVDDPFAAPVRLLEELIIWPSRIRSLQVVDKQGDVVDVTRPQPGTRSFPAWGDDPEPTGNGPSLVIGLFPALPRDERLGARFSIRIDLDGTGSDAGSRALREPVQGQGNVSGSRFRRAPIGASAPTPTPLPWNGLPIDPEWTSPPTASTPPSQVAWEYYDPEASGWRPLYVMNDPTQGLTRDGTIRLCLPRRRDHARSTGSVIPDRRFHGQTYQYIRCRLVSGRPDSAPRVARIEIHAALVEQSVPALSRFKERSRTYLNRWQRVSLKELATNFLQVDGRVIVGPTEEDVRAAETSVVIRVIPENGMVRLSARKPLSAREEPPLYHWIVPAEMLGSTTPEPDGSTRIVLGPSAIAAGSLRVVSLEPDSPAGSFYQLRSWKVDSLPPGARSSGSRAWIDAGSSELRFGDGRFGRALPAGSFLIVAYDTTEADRGNPPPRRRYFMPGLSEPSGGPLTQQQRDQLTPLAVWNRSLLGKSSGAGATFPPVTVLSGDRLDGDLARAGISAERVSEALTRLSTSTRAISAIANEASKHGGTIDGAEPDVISRLLPPPRAAIGADFERLALATPGASVRRARAFEGRDPRYPGLSTPGGVTLVVLPELPRQRPTPTESLLNRVSTHLGRLRVLGTRLKVIGPEYVPISLYAVVATDPAQPVSTVLRRAEQDLRSWLDPLTWPFGIVPTATEILARLSAVEGVIVASDVRLASPSWPHVPWALPSWDRLDLVPDPGRTRR